MYDRLVNSWNITFRSPIEVCKFKCGFDNILGILSTVMYIKNCKVYHNNVINAPFLHNHFRPCQNFNKANALECITSYMLYTLMTLILRTCF